MESPILGAWGESIGHSLQGEGLPRTSLLSFMTQITVLPE